MSTLIEREVPYSFNATADDSEATTRLHLSENHWGCSAAVRDAVERELERAHVYPDPDSTKLRAAIADFFDVTPKMVLVGNGTDELVLLSALTFVGPGLPGVTSAATFPGYRTSMKLVGAQVREVPLKDMAVDLEAMASEAQRQAGAVYVCNPHNPTGTAASSGALTHFLETLASTEALPIIDEAYIDFASAATSSAVDWIREGGRAMALRTLSKASGIAGFRVGFAIGPERVIEQLTRAACALPFRVSRYAQAAGVAAITHHEHTRQVAWAVQRARSTLGLALEARGYEYIASETNFVAFKTKRDSRAVAEELREAHRLLVRDCGPFGLHGWIRASVGPEAQMQHLLSALDAADAVA